MVVVLTGGTGLVGRALGKELSSKGYTVHLLVRRVQQNIPYPCKTFLWPDVKSDLPQQVFPKEGSYGVIHLSGEPINRWPWTRHTKEGISSSRIEGCKKLVTALKKHSHPPEFFLSAGAVGIYGEQGEKQMTEESPVADQNLFLQKVCKSWEEEALKAASMCRTLVFRFGIVMSYKKGFLYEQAKWIKRACLPLLISQRPLWLSWISLEDLTRMLLWAIDHKEANGIYNAVSPNPISLKSFYTSLIKYSEKRILKLPFPLFLARQLGGEMTRNLLISCKAFPERALSQGFVFQKAEIGETLKTI